MLVSIKLAFDCLAGAIDGVKEWFDRMADAFDNWNSPDLFTPGSPTPFETGMRGIAAATRDAQMRARVRGG